jgi:hypothetical protein
LTERVAKTGITPLKAKERTPPRKARREEINKEDVLKMITERLKQIGIMAKAKRAAMPELP